MDLQRIREALEQLLEYDVLPDELREKLQEILAILQRAEKEAEPELITYARLLSELIEELGDEMPPVIDDFIKLYAAALKSAIGWTQYLTCIRYYLIREQGASHEDAASTANLTGDAAEWCRVLWNLNHLPPVTAPDPDDTDAPDILEGPINDSDWLPTPPTVPDGGVAWLDEHAQCCEGGGKDIAPTVNWGNFHINPSDPSSSVRTVSGSITVSHPCGILWSDIRIIAGGSGIDVLASGIDHDTVDSTQEQFTMKMEDGEKIFTFNNMPVSHAATDLLSIRAISNCFTALEPPVESPI